MTDALDDLFEDEEKNQEGSTSGSENSTIQAIRKSEREAKKRAKEIEAQFKEVQAELAVFKQEKRKAEVAKAFDGVDPVYAELFEVKHEGDVTTEAVNAFLAERGLQRETSTEEAPPPVDEPKGFRPTEGLAGEPASTRLTEEQVEDLIRNDPERFAKAVETGKYKAPRLEDLWPAGEAGETGF
jgi:hypothetical protein